MAWSLSNPLDSLTVRAEVVQAPRKHLHAGGPFLHRRRASPVNMASDTVEDPPSVTTLDRNAHAGRIRTFSRIHVCGRITVSFTGPSQDDGLFGRQMHQGFDRDGACVPCCNDSSISETGKENDDRCPSSHFPDRPGHR